MADSILIQRLAKRLQEAADGTPKGEGFWPALAVLAATECERTVTTTNKPLPVLAFLALAKRREVFVPLLDGATLGDIYAQVLPLFDAGQPEDVWIVEVKRIVSEQRP